MMLGPPEYWDEHAGRLFAKRRARVMDNDDPRKLGRIKVVLPRVYGDDLSPWAWPNMGSGFTVPAVGDWVWLEFEEGHPAHPIWTGVFHWETEDIKTLDGSPIENGEEHFASPNTAPEHAQGKLDGSDVDGSEKGMGDVPFSNANPRYPHVWVWESPSKRQFLEFDDSPDDERIQVMHRTGSHIEFLPDGSINVVSSGRVLVKGKAVVESSEGSVQRKADGKVTQDYAQDFETTLGGSYALTAGRGVVITGQKREVTIEGADEEDVGTKSVETSGAMQLTSGGDLNLGAFNNISVNAGGFLSLLATNALNAVPTGLPPYLGPIADSILLVGQAGRATLMSTDPTGAIGQFGIECQGQNAVTLSTVPLPTEIGPHVRLGNLLTPALPVPTLLVQEPVVLGMQLSLFLTALTTFLQQWLADYLLHVHPEASPPVTAAIQGPILTPQLTALQTTLAPAGPLLQSPLLSDVVFASKV